MHAVEWVALVVALLGILNTLLVSVLERTRELGLLRAVGMSRRQVFRMILLEILYQGLAGGVVSVAMGSVLAYFWMTYSLSEVLGMESQLHYPWGIVAQTIFSGIGVALLAGYLPARRASGIEIREALAYE
jgi:putative ABC transport system permease protein